MDRQNNNKKQHILPIINDGKRDIFINDSTIYHSIKTIWRKSPKLLAQVFKEIETKDNEIIEKYHRQMHLISFSDRKKYLLDHLPMNDLFKKWCINMNLSDINREFEEKYPRRESDFERYFNEFDTLTKYALEITSQR